MDADVRHPPRPVLRHRAHGSGRVSLTAAPVLAGILATVGALADPAPGTEGHALIEAYAAEPGRVQIKSLGYHFS